MKASQIIGSDTDYLFLDASQFLVDLGLNFGKCKGPSIHAEVLRMLILSNFCSPYHSAFS